MKKKSFVLSILLVFCILVSPLRASAASGQIFGASSDGYVESTKTFDESKTTLNGNTVKIVNNGANTKIYLGLKVTEGTVNNYNATLTLSNSSFKFLKYSKATGWTGSVTDNGDGTISINLTNSTGVTASSGDANGNILVATITLDATSATSTDTCTIGLSTASTPETPENPTCTIDGDTYYCADGTVCTEEEYTAQCENPENPQTGSFLPYAVIIGGIGLAAVLYLVTKKNKIYHV